MGTRACEAVVVHCIDFRIQSAVHEHLQSQFPGRFDRVSVAGGVRELVERGEDSFVLQQIRISHDLHQPRTIALMQHEDCGAYGGSEAFDGAEVELDFQKKQLQKAEELLKQQFPECTIHKYFVHLSQEVIEV